MKSIPSLMNAFDDYSDPQLTTLIRQDDRRAFEVIYRRYASELFRYACRIIPKEDAEEMIQDIFEWLWVRREELQITSLRRYLFTAMRHKIIRYIEHKAVKKKYEEHYLFFEEVYDSIDKNEPNPDAIQQQILKSIKDLPERCQTAFRMRLLENLSGSEIAERMNIAKRTVENYIFIANQHLRLSLGKTYKDIG